MTKVLFECDRNTQCSCPDCSDTEDWSPNVIRCRVCGLGKTVIGNAGNNLQNYQQIGETNKAERRKYFSRLLQMTGIMKLPVGRSLDVGCADGLLVDLLKEYGWVSSGVDSFSGPHLHHLRIHRCSIESLEMLNQYNLITMIHSLEHLPQPEEVLKKLRDRLFPGGSLVIVVPNFAGTWCQLKEGSWDWLNVEEHYFHYTPMSLERILNKVGWKVYFIATSSRDAPPLLVQQASFWGWFNVSPKIPKVVSRILLSLIYRLTHLMSPFWEYLPDKRLKGAELIVVAQVAEIEMENTN